MTPNPSAPPPGLPGQKIKVLVTGCAGFIGSKVSELLLQQGHEVVGIDSMNDAYDVRMKKWRLTQLEFTKDFRFYLMDVTDRPALRDIFQSAGRFDAIINMAARAGIRQSVLNPWLYYETNVTGTLNLLELAREMGTKKIVLASTSSVYGNAKLPLSENLSTDTPLSPYAATKKAAEGLCYSYHYLYGLDVSVPRFFTVYGRAGRPDMSVFRFIRWIAEGDPVMLYGDGSQERDFTYVDDIARGVIAALKPVGFEVINLGGDRPVSINSIIRMVEERLDKSARITSVPPHPADIQATWADISKARQLLCWEPRTSIEEGLTAAVDWYLENRDWAKHVSLDDVTAAPEAGPMPSSLRGVYGDR